MVEWLVSNHYRNFLIITSEPSGNDLNNFRTHQSVVVEVSYINVWHESDLEVAGLENVNFNVTSSRVILMFPVIPSHNKCDEFWVFFLLYLLNQKLVDDKTFLLLITVRSERVAFLRHHVWITTYWQECRHRVVRFKRLTTF